MFHLLGAPASGSAGTSVIMTATAGTCSARRRHHDGANDDHHRTGTGTATARPRWIVRATTSTRSIMSPATSTCAIVRLPSLGSFRRGRTLRWSLICDPEVLRQFVNGHLGLRN